MSIWTEQKSIGDAGERIIKQYMELKGNEVEDISMNPAYWEQDIDFIINSRTVEVKTDNIISSSGNLFLEYEIEHYPEGKLSKRDKGWFSKCKAEYLFYYDIRKDILRVYELNDLKEYINNHYVSTIQHTDCYDNGYIRIINGYKVAADDVPHTKVFNLKGVI